MLKLIQGVPLSFMSGFSKFFTTERIVLLVVIALLAWGVFTYGAGKGASADGMTNAEEPKEEAAPAKEATESAPSGYKAKEAAAPRDLLPKDENAAWSDATPVAVDKTKGVMGPDLLSAGHHIGIDTIGQSLRNANQQLRSDPVISKQDVGPWHNSTIEADTTRIPLELGN